MGASDQGGSPRNWKYDKDGLFLATGLIVETWLNVLQGHQKLYACMYVLSTYSKIKETQSYQKLEWIILRVCQVLQDPSNQFLSYVLTIQTFFNNLLEMYIDIMDGRSECHLCPAFLSTFGCQRESLLIVLQTRVIKNYIIYQYWQGYQIKASCEHH